MAEVCDNAYDWGTLTKMLDERYNCYHVNAPNTFETLSFNEVIDFGEISGNVYHLSPMKYKEKILKKKDSSPNLIMVFSNIPIDVTSLWIQ